MGQLQSIHGSRHGDVREHCPDVVMQFEKLYRLVGIASLIHDESASPHEVDSIHPQQKFVFHD